MPSVTYTSYSSNRPIAPDIYRRSRLRRIGVQGAIASVVADLAFGPARDDAVLASVFAPNVEPR